MGYTLFAALKTFSLYKYLTVVCSDITPEVAASIIGIWFGPSEYIPVL